MRKTVAGPLSNETYNFSNTNDLMNRLSSFAIAALLLVFTKGVGLQGAILSSNLNQPTSYTELVEGSTFIASSFGTGAYNSTLKDVGLLMQFDIKANPIVALYSNTGDQPGTFLGQLISPVLYTTGLQLTLFDGNQLPLAANTTYWIVAQAGSGSYEWAYTVSNLGNGSGFQHTWAITENAGSSWFVSNTEPMQMQVEDSSVATPEPATILLLVVGLAVSRYKVRPR